ncbi:MAG: RtcB family protein [Deltaproteobacteria bacterium]|nr:RtcB family protein [Deltaproteobacteria bacterium]
MGQPAGFEEAFGSTWHGTGRMLGKKAAEKASKARSINRKLEDKGIYVRRTGRSTLPEEIQGAYRMFPKGLR